MKEGYKGEDKPRLPEQQAQQPQQSQGEGDQASFLAIGPDAETGSAPAADDDKNSKPAFDHARLENGLGDFYMAVLKEPVPEKMLRLIEQLAKREQE